jgi:TRAP-type C4-dicarboxylate transport system permease large subunit
VHYSYEMMIQEHKILAVLVFVLFVFDCFLTFYLKKNKIKTNNKYYNLQKNYNSATVIIVKLLSILCLIYFLIDPPGNAGAVWAIAVIYCLLVIILTIDSVKAFRASKSGKG